MWSLIRDKCSHNLLLGSAPADASSDCGVAHVEKGLPRLWQPRRLELGEWMNSLCCECEFVLNLCFSSLEPCAFFQEVETATMLGGANPVRSLCHTSRSSSSRRLDLPRQSRQICWDVWYYYVLKLWYYLVMFSQGEELRRQLHGVRIQLVLFWLWQLWHVTFGSFLFAKTTLRRSQVFSRT